MKNTPLSALVMVGATGLVGTVAWLTWGYRAPIEPAPAVTTSVQPVKPRVMDLTPWERRMKGRLEQAERQIEQYKQEGKVLRSGAIKTKDIDGSPMYVHPELIEGTGRFGEPKYVMAKYKRRAPVPLRELKATPKAPELQPKLAKAPKGTLNFDEKTDAQKALESSGGVGSGDGDEGGWKGGKKKTPKKGG